MKISNRSFVTILLLILSIVVVFSFVKPPKEDKDQFEIEAYLTEEEISFVEEMQELEFTIGIAEGNDSAFFLVDKLEEVFDLTFKTVVYEDFGNLIEDTLFNEIDFATYISYSDERSHYLDFSSPIGLENVYLYTNNVINIEDIEGKTILVSRGSIFEKYITENFDDVSIEYYLTIEEGLDRLENGEVFGLVGAQRTYQNALSHGLIALDMKRYIPISPVYIASKKNKNEQLLQILSKYTSTKFYSNELRIFELENKYQLDLDSLKAQVEKSSLSKDKIYKVMLEYDDPYVFERKGEVVGYTVDIVAEVFELLNLEYRIVNSKETTWSFMYDSLLTNEIDILGSMAITEERTDIINFSNPIWRSDYYIIERAEEGTVTYSNLIDLQSQNIGVVNNDFRHQFLESVFPNKIFTVYDDPNSLMEGFLSKEVDYIVLSEVQHTNFIFKTRRTDIKINSEIGSIINRDIALGFNKNNEGRELANLFSSAYNLINLNGLKTKYFESVSIESYYQQEQLYLALLIVAISSAALIILFISRKKLRGDWPTKTLNRYAFKSDFKNGIGTDKSFIFIDINKLKQLNDIYGHLLVDRILLEYCTRVSSTRHKVYRVGGDEFVIVDTFKHKDNLYDFAKFLSEQHIVFEDEGVDITLEASIGVIERVGDVMVEDIYNPRSYLLSLADHTMYRAKNDAVLKIKYCTREDIESHLLKIEIENIAERPIKDVGIYPVFQPIYDYKTKDIVGFEALARWQNEDSSYMPDQFIPVFENLNKIAELDIFIFESAVAMLEEYIKQNPKSDAVFVTSNFSVKSLGFLKVEDFNKVIAKYNVPKKNILIEITESTFFDNNCYKLIESLKENDYFVAIDDFSSGHSTINSIVALDVDVVKIDKYIVENISKKMVREEDYYKELLILEAITKLIKSIESKVIVEGIESSMIDNIIATAEIDFVQGNNYSLPITIEQVFKLKD